MSFLNITDPTLDDPEYADPNWVRHAFKILEAVVTAAPKDLFDLYKILFVFKDFHFIIKNVCVMPSVVSHIYVNYTRAV